MRARRRCDVASPDFEAESSRFDRWSHSTLRPSVVVAVLREQARPSLSRSSLVVYTLAMTFYGDRHYSAMCSILDERVSE
jgi:hypothetical protein